MQEPTFEESLKRLEEIVTQLEGNKLALEQSLQVFEEGVKLVRFCAGRLDEAERRIEILAGRQRRTVACRAISRGTRGYHGRSRATVSRGRNDYGRYRALLTGAESAR